MNEIKLEELPKSKEFMEQARIADGLTKETSLEHGFTFCKSNDKIVIDKMCVGTKCDISIGTEKCDVHTNDFHTHPHDNRTWLSIGDVHNSSYHSYLSKKPHIKCVKPANNDNIHCNKSNIKNEKMMSEIKTLAESFYKEPTYVLQQTVLLELDEKIKPESILFNIETNEIVKQQ